MRVIVIVIVKYTQVSPEEHLTLFQWEISTVSTIFTVSGCDLSQRQCNAVDDYSLDSMIQSTKSKYR